MNFLNGHKLFTIIKKGIIMLRCIYSFTFIIAILYGRAFATDSPSERFSLHEIFGEPTNNIQPEIEIQKSGTNWSDWSIGIDFIAKANFTRNTWLKITNRVGSKLQLWLTNGMELQSTNSGVLAAMNLPAQTTVSEVMHGVHPSNTRGMQWLRTNPTGVGSGDIASATTFSLQNAFDVSFTNDVVLQISPLIYKVETNGAIAHLVEFPPIKMKLMANGNVQKLDTNK